MSQADASRGRLPKGVSALPRPRGGRSFRASVRKGKGVIIHLGLYETPWLAAFAYNHAAELLGHERKPADIPREGQPGADRVQEIRAHVRRRLGLDAGSRRRPSVETCPDPEDLLTFFEVTVVGRWRALAADDQGGPPGAGLDSSALRIVEASRLLFWSPSAGHPSPPDATARLLARRLDQTFRNPDLTRELLDDDGDDPWRVARWLAYPDAVPGLRVRPFRQEVMYLYPETFEAVAEPAGWASLLGLSPPYRAEDVRAAFRARSRSAHPDTGGSAREFVRLREAYEEALAYCASRRQPD